MKNEVRYLGKFKGITLIALVITVIIMLILAGVAISAITSGGDLFEKTRDIVGIYQQETQNETDQIRDLINEINEFLPDTIPPEVPSISQINYKRFKVKGSIINNIESLGKITSPTGSLENFRTTSDNPEIEISTDNITGISKIRLGIYNLNDDLNIKIYYTQGEEYSESDSTEVNFLKNEHILANIVLPKANYKKIKFRMGDKEGLEYAFGTIDIIGDANCINNAIIRYNLSSTDNIGIEKFQYSEDMVDWKDCYSSIDYREGWNKTYYYRAVDFDGNVSPATEGFTINIDAQNPTSTLSADNITPTSFTLNANGTDNESGVSKYELYINNVIEKIENSTSEDVVFDITDKTPNTTYKCKVRVYDLAGNYKDSNEITVTTN